MFLFLYGAIWNPQLCCEGNWKTSFSFGGLRWSSHSASSTLCDSLKSLACTTNWGDHQDPSRKSTGATGWIKKYIFIMFQASPTLCLHAQQNSLIVVCLTFHTNLLLSSKNSRFWMFTIDQPKIWNWMFKIVYWFNTWIFDRKNSRFSLFQI